MSRESATPQVIEINQIDQLEDLRLIWTLLASQTRGASFFHTLDWLQAYWQHFGMGQQLRVLVVWSGGTPVGILPLTVTREKTRVGTVRVLTYPLHDWGTFFGPIGPNPTATLTLAMQHIHNTPRDWDLLDLRWVNRDEHDHLRTPWAMQHAGYVVRESTWKTTAVIDMTEDWHGYWESRSSKLRNNMVRDERHLSEMGTVELERDRPSGTACGDDDPRWDLYDTCCEIARESWQGTSDSGTTLSHDSVCNFFRQAHAMAVKNGMVDLNLLRVNGKAVAYAYNYVTAGHLTGVRRGYLPQYASCGVGNVIFVRMLRDSFEREDGCLDLGPDSMAIKRRWSSRLINSYRYTHYPLLAPRAQMLRFKHWTVSHHTSPTDELTPA